MARQLQIKSGRVVAEWHGSGATPLPPDDSWTFLDVSDRPDAQVGMTYDAGTDTFTPPPAPRDYGATVSPRTFMLLFSGPERKAIRAASKTDDDVADFLAIAQVPEPIRLRHPMTLAGLDMLVVKGLLTESARARISSGASPN